MIENKTNFLYMARNTLARILAGTNGGRETTKGVLWAIKFVSALDHDTMTERELSHACRCMTYRGQQEPRFC